MWALLAGQEEELVEVAKDISEVCFSERIIEQTVEIAVPRESEAVAGGMSDQHWLVMLGVFFRRWTWTNTTIANARIRERRG